MGLQKTIIGGVVVFILGAAAGAGIMWWGQGPPADRPEWAGATVSPAIVRDYADPSQGTISGAYLVALKCMDTGPMTIDKEETGLDELKIKCQLCERKAERTLKINRTLPKNILGADVIIEVNKDFRTEIRYELDYYRNIFGHIYFGGGVILGGSSVGIKAGLRCLL